MPEAVRVKFRLSSKLAEGKVKVKTEKGERVLKLNWKYRREPAGRKKQSPDRIVLEELDGPFVQKNNLDCDELKSGYRYFYYQFNLKRPHKLIEMVTETVEITAWDVEVIRDLEEIKTKYFGNKGEVAKITPSPKKLKKEKNRTDKNPLAQLEVTADNFDLAKDFYERILKRLK